MQLYSCKVRLHGSLLHEVRKDEVTPAEVYVLRAIHGDDAVTDIEHLGRASKDSHAAERERLHEQYAGALESIDSIRHLNGVFGVGRDLPEALPGVPVRDAKSRRAAPRRESVPMVDETTKLATDADVDDFEDVA